MLAGRVVGKGKGKGRGSMGVDGMDAVQGTREGTKGIKIYFFLKKNATWHAHIPLFFLLRNGIPYY